MSADQEKAGETPHTLHERRPRNDEDIQQNIQPAYLQQAGQQRESLSGKEQEEGLEGVTGLQKVPETTLPGTQNLGPGPFTFTYYGEAELWRLMTSIIPREHQERTHLHGRDWCQDVHANRSEQLIQDGTENYKIKDTWINLIQAEDYLLRGIMAFLPRIQQEETNPTFEHPEDWDRLNLREKANLIIFDNIVKLMELQCRGSVIGHQEGETQNTSSTGLLGSGTNPRGRGLNTDVGPTGDL